MNRKIKFRAWHQKKLIMRFVPAIWFAYEEGPSKIDLLGEREQEDERDIILMQYTGLKDKKGKEIYEGDILKNEWGQKSKVEYGEFYDNGIYISGFGISVCPEESEVIGNIYKNPELLTNNI